MTKKKRETIGKVIFVVLVAIAAVVGMSYGSTLVFFNLHKLDFSAAGPFTIWEYWQVYRQSPDKFIKISVNACAFGPYVIAVAAPIMILLSKKQRALHGDARFATLAEVRQAGLIDPKDGYDRTILVGKFKNKYLTYGGYQFVMLAAPTRSGKGVGVVIPNCLNYSDSLVVLDIKLENFEITSGFRKAHGQEVYLFCPFDEKGRSHRYNPLEYISKDPAARIGDIDAIATALYSGGDDKDKFWSENAKDLFRGLCLLVLEHPTLPKTLGEILRQASGKGKPFKDHINEMFAEAEKEGRPFSPSCTDALNRILNNSENTMAGIVSTFNGPLLIFQNPRVDLATSANDFDLRDVRRKRMTIYLGVTPDKLKDAAVIVNLFFDQLLNLNTRVLPQQDKSLKYQCLLILDEFTAIGKVAMIQQAISYQAGYNMRVLTIIQNKSQLEDKYGKSGAITLMANHALMVMYAPSPVVQSDANEYSEMLGYQTVKAKNKSKSFASTMGSSGSRSESESDQRRALMLPQELKELGRWREIVSLENCKPILCDKIKYFEDPAFTERTNWPIEYPEPLDIDTHIAQLEGRRREVTAEDVQNNTGEELQNKLVGADGMPSEEELMEEWEEVQADMPVLPDEMYEDLAEEAMRQQAEEAEQAKQEARTAFVNNAATNMAASVLAPINPELTKEEIKQKLLTAEQFGTSDEEAEELAHGFDAFGDDDEDEVQTSENTEKTAATNDKADELTAALAHFSNNRSDEGTDEETAVESVDTSSQANEQEQVLPEQDEPVEEHTAEELEKIFADVPLAEYKQAKLDPEILAGLGLEADDAQKALDADDKAALSQLGIADDTANNSEDFLTKKGA